MRIMKYVLIFIFTIIAFILLIDSNKAGQIYAWTEEDEPVFIEPYPDVTNDTILRSIVEAEVDSNDNVYFLDNESDRITKWSSQGGFIKRIGQRGTEFGQFGEPVDMFIRYDEIYVLGSDGELYFITQYDTEGNFVRRIDFPISGDGVIVYPFTIALDQERNIYISDQIDNSYHLIKKYDNDGNFIRLWGAKGYDNGGSSNTIYVYDMDINSNNDVYIAVNIDASNPPIHKVICYDSDGNWKWEHRPSTYWADSTHGIKTFEDKYVLTASNWIGIYKDTSLIRKIQSTNFEPGLSTGSLRYVGVSSNNQFWIVLTVWGMSSIYKIDQDGNVLLRFDQNVYQFYSAESIKVDRNSVVYIANRNLHKITIYKDRNTVKTFGNYGTSDGQFNNPSSLNIDSVGNIWVADNGNNRIQVFNSSYEFIIKFGSFCNISNGSGCVDPDGTGPLALGDGQFNGPRGIAFDNYGNSYVVDTGNYRIQKFDSEGHFILKWGSYGNSGGGFFLSPRYLDISNDRVFVTDRSRNIVQVFDLNGVFLTSFGGNGSADGQFTNCSGIASDLEGNIYVVNYASGPSSRIQKFKYDEDTLTYNYVTKYFVYGFYVNDVRYMTVAVTGITLNKDTNELYYASISNSFIGKLKFDREEPLISAPSTIDPIFKTNTITSKFVVVDDLTAINSVEYTFSTDPGNWYPCNPVDGVWDSKEEEVECVFEDLEDGYYELIIRSTDSKTNTNSQDTSLRYSFLVDTTPPLFNKIGDYGYINVIEDQIIYVNPYTIRVSSTDLTSGIDRVDFYIDDNLICSVKEANDDGSFSCDWDTSKYHSDVRVVAYDNVGWNTELLVTAQVHSSLYQTGVNLFLLVRLICLFSVLIVKLTKMWYNMKVFNL